MPRANIQIGQKFNRLTVIGTGTTAIGLFGWKCRCVCGKEGFFQSNRLTSGHVKSCGCYQRDSLRARRLKHGAKSGGNVTQEYRIWSGMKQRCLNPKAPNFVNYGGRGIKVCARWVNSFDNFLADIGPIPTPKHSIERNDNNGNYEPSNCVWADRKTQALNTRRNKWILFKGESKTLGQWGISTGMGRDVIAARLKMGWTVEKSLTLPVRPINRGFNF